MFRTLRAQQNLKAAGAPIKVLRAAALSLCLAVGWSMRAADWVRAGLNTNQPLWGVRGGLLWAVPPGGFRAAGGPRGLIRVGYPISTNGGYDLINFIAVEPIVNGRRGFSELELSALDQTRGKRIWAVGETNLASGGPPPALAPGKLTRPSAGVEQLEVTVLVEPFNNGARVRLIVSQRSDAPDEIQLSVHAESGSAPLDYCILTATMGNLARTRLLWLKDEVVSSLRLYPDYSGDGFAPPRIYPLDRLARTPSGDVLVAVTNNEDDPASVYPFPGQQAWHYGGDKVTQYWKKPRGTARVSNRQTGWLRWNMGLSAEDIPEVRVQGIEPDLFERTGLAVLFLQFAAALSLAHANPVGRLVGGAFKARAFDKGFQKDRPVAIAPAPIGQQRLDCPG